MSAETQLAILPPKEKALQVFQTERGLDPYLKHIRDQIDTFVPDVTTRKGREAIASIAYTVARSKTALDNRGKELVSELKEIPKLIDAERKRMRETLDAWQEEVRRPLNEWQAAEDARVDRHREVIAHLENTDTAGMSASLIGARIQDLDSCEINEEMEEFEAEAHRAKAASLATLRAALTAQEKVEADQRELEERRAADAKREQEEREARIAQQAADAVRKQAEESATAIQRELEAEKARSRKAEEDRIATEQQAERDRIAAEQRAEVERVASVRRAEEAAENARNAELRRQQEEAAEARRQQQAREADKAHKGAVNRAALEAFIAGGMPEACAKQAVTLIAKRLIPAVTITY